MSQQVFANGKHRFTDAESALGANRSVRSRRGVIRDIRKLTGLELEWETLQEVLKVGAVWVATPVGQVVTGVLVTKGLAKAGIFSEQDANNINDVILAAEVMSALGASNLIPQIGSLGAALK